jgi:hypothetical protein
VHQADLSRNVSLKLVKTAPYFYFEPSKWFAMVRFSLLKLRRYASVNQVGFGSFWLYRFYSDSTKWRTMARFGFSKLRCYAWFQGL